MQISREFSPVVDERGALDIFGISLSYLKIFDEAVLWKSDDDMSVEIHFSEESKEQWFDRVYEIYTKLAHPIIVNISEGDGLLVKSEDVPRYSRNGASFSYIIQQNGDKDIYALCHALLHRSWQA